jgi:DNA-binding NarL/FixJ family response regulator
MTSGPTAVTHGATRVVMVEDDLRFRTAFAVAIARAGDLLLQAQVGTVTEGLALLRGPPADVLLTDLGLPDGSGIDLIRAARQAWPRCDVLVISIFGDESHVLLAIQAGAAGYLLKDSSPEQFVEQIRSVRAGGSPISPLIARRLLLRFQGQAPADLPLPLPAATGDLAEPLLSARETEVLGHLSRGFTCDEVARMLGLSRHTVLTYVRRIYGKLEVNSKPEAMYEARKLGLLRD